MREGDRLEAVPIAGFETPELPGRIEWHNGLPEVELVNPPQTLSIFRAP